jgi:hypothetical protein
MGLTSCWGVLLLLVVVGVRWEMLSISVVTGAAAAAAAAVSAVDSTAVTFQPVMILTPSDCRACTHTHTGVRTMAENQQVTVREPHIQKSM